MDNIVALSTILLAGAILFAGVFALVASIIIALDN